MSTPPTIRRLLARASAPPAGTPTAAASSDLAGPVVRSADNGAAPWATRAPGAALPRVDTAASRASNRTVSPTEPAGPAATALSHRSDPSAPSRHRSRPAPEPALVAVPPTDSPAAARPVVPDVPPDLPRPDAADPGATAPAAALAPEHEVAAETDPARPHGPTAEPASVPATPRPSQPAPVRTEPADAGSPPVSERPTDASPPTVPVQIGRIEVQVAAPTTERDPFAGLAAVADGLTARRGGGW